MKIKFKLFRMFGANNSKPVFDAFEQGVVRLGHRVVDLDYDVAVIWSVLWNGKMRGNEQIYKHARLHNRPVVVIEVGSLKRNHTWKVALNHINNQGYYGNHTDLDPSRQDRLGVSLAEYNHNRKDEILIACQRQDSLLWNSSQSIENWVNSTVSKIMQFSDRQVLVRPHPRFAVNSARLNAKLDLPKRIVNTYDSFNIDFDYHCVINYSSGPGIQSLINGTPVITDSTSLAYSLSNRLEDIENLKYFDRQDWFLRMCHSEWTVDEISKGVPLGRIMPALVQQLD